MKLREIAERTDKELTQLITDTQDQIASARVDLRTKQVPNVKQIKALRKTLAQAKTIARQREIGAEESQQPTEASAKGRKETNG